MPPRMKTLHGNATIIARSTNRRHHGHISTARPFFSLAAQASIALRSLVVFSSLNVTLCPAEPLNTSSTWRISNGLSDGDGGLKCGHDGIRRRQWNRLATGIEEWTLKVVNVD